MVLPGDPDRALREDADYGRAAGGRHDADAARIDGADLRRRERRRGTSACRFESRPASRTTSSTRSSATRDKLTALARGYEDLSWVPASSWADAARAGVPARLAAGVRPRRSRVVAPGPAGARLTRTRSGRSSFRSIRSGPCRRADERHALAMRGRRRRRCAHARSIAGARCRHLALRLRCAHRGGAAPVARGGVRCDSSSRPLLPHEPATCTGALPPFV